MLKRLSGRKTGISLQLHRENNMYLSKCIDSAVLQSRISCALRKETLTEIL